MDACVLKFGGTSLQDISRIKEIGKRIIKYKKLGKSPVVVVSAMNKTTDELIRMSKEFSLHPDKRELDLMLSTGEQVSASLLAIYLKAKGYKAISFNAFQLPIITDSDFGRAKILSVNVDKIKKHLEMDYIVVITGYQGVVNDTRNITTLGRGGSDTTALAMTLSLGLKSCEIFTDVDGVFTADPEMIPEAQKLNTISYEEMLELAGGGARVMHPRAVLLAQKNDIVIHVKNSFHNNPGTLIKNKQDINKSIVTGVTYTSNEARVSFEKIPVSEHKDYLSRIFRMIAEEEVNINLIAKNHSGDFADLSFAVEKSDLIRLVHLIKLLSQEIRARRVVFDTDFSRVTIIGSGMKNCPGVAFKMFSALQEKQIQIHMISTSDIKVSVFVDNKDLFTAVKAVHEKFELSKGPYRGDLGSTKQAFTS
ncbi:aspartate kinase [bacterium]|nr:aspartate kinase [bacterium]